MYRVNIYSDRSEQILFSQWFETYAEAVDWIEATAYIRSKRHEIIIEED